MILKMDHDCICIPCFSYSHYRLVVMNVVTDVLCVGMLKQLFQGSNLQKI
jgi:hypothetical protein